MTIPIAVAAEIRRLYFAEHWRRGTIAAQLGVHFDTVVRVLGSFGPKAGTPRPDARVLEPYVPFVDETLGVSVVTKLEGWASTKNEGDEVRAA